MPATAAPGASDALEPLDETESGFRAIPIIIYGPIVVPASVTIFGVRTTLYRPGVPEIPGDHRKKGKKLCNIWDLPYCRV